MERFTNQVVVITGASSGIGRVLALTLATERTRLVLAARDVRRLDEVDRECRALGAESIVVPTDVTIPAECQALIARAVDRFGQLDVLVNNAGRAMWAPFEQLENLSVFEDLMRVNYLGSVHCTFHALPHLRATRGRILAMASTSGLTGVPFLSGYAASKHAMIGFFESLRIELRGSGVSVTIAAPDFVQSEVLERAIGPDGQPLGHSPLNQSSLLTAEKCVGKILRALRARRRLVLTSFRGSQLRMGKLLVPEIVDRITASAVRWK